MVYSCFALISGDFSSILFIWFITLRNRTLLFCVFEFQRLSIQLPVTVEIDCKASFPFFTWIPGQKHYYGTRAKRQNKDKYILCICGTVLARNEYNHALKPYAPLDYTTTVCIDHERGGKESDWWGTYATRTTSSPSFVKHLSYPLISQLIGMH
jgi:hypothetical protein